LAVPVAFEPAPESETGDETDEAAEEVGEEATEEVPTRAALGAACGVTAGFVAGVATCVKGVAAPLERTHCIHNAYPPAATSTTAAATSNIFLLPRPAVLSPLLTLPPKVNAGAGVASLEELFSLESAIFAGLSGSGITVWGFGSRAGAGALAAPDPNPAGLAAECPIVGERISGWLSATPRAAIAGEATSSLISKISASLSLSAETETATLGCGGC